MRKETEYIREWIYMNPNLFESFFTDQGKGKAGLGGTRAGVLKDYVWHKGKKRSKSCHGSL